ncbi:MAG: phosphoribosylglycinamide formyltransferase [Pseudomonadota bacterium]
MTAGRMGVAVLISGRGSNMEALIRATTADDFPARIVGVLSNDASAAGLQTASKAGLPIAAIDHRQFPSRQAFEKAVDAQIVEWGADLVACAGFMRILSDYFVSRWHGRLVNIHPSLLPLFKGLHTHERALEAGVRIHGCTTHFVTGGVDEGPILLQAAVPVLPGDTAETLATRVLREEHRIYPETIRQVALGNLSLEKGRVTVNGTLYDRNSVLAPTTTDGGRSE